jgi:hypothetical protein
MTYIGVSNYINDEFEYFIPLGDKRFNVHDMLFVHDFEKIILTKIR